MALECADESGGRRVPEANLAIGPPRSEDAAIR